MSLAEEFVVGGGYLMQTAKYNKDTCKIYHYVRMQYTNYLQYIK